MKVTIDTKENDVIKIEGKPVEEVSDDKRKQVGTAVRNFIRKYTGLTDYENDCMWMSYRYCIGRHTIAAHMHASDIWYNCKGRMSKDKELFAAYDINREIESYLAFLKPNFRFPITSLNRIYTSAIDIVCEFFEDYNIKSLKDLRKYKDIEIILADNERGYKIETTTWEEVLRPKIIKEISKLNIFNNEEQCWKLFTDWEKEPASLKNNDAIENIVANELDNYFKEITKNMPKLENYWDWDIMDLFVWNDLVHCFDNEHHHKSILVDGSECVWFWTWTKNYEVGDDNICYPKFGYRKIRVPLDKWNGTVTTWISDEVIKENLY